MGNIMTFLRRAAVLFFEKSPEANEYVGRPKVVNSKGKLFFGTTLARLEADSRPLEVAFSSTSRKKKGRKVDDRGKKRKSPSAIKTS